MDMFKLILKIILYALPAGLVFLFPAYVYWQAHEFITPQQVVALQNEPQQVLFGLAYDDFEKAYKLELVSQRDPQVIALGASRVMEFRGFFFNPGVSFVNASRFVAFGGVDGFGGTKDLVRFVQALPKQVHPQIIIVGLDPWMFAPGQDAGHITEQPTLFSQIKAFFSGEWRKPYDDYFHNKFTLSDLAMYAPDSHTIGLTALIKHNGYLNDGSYYQGSWVEHPDLPALKALIATHKASAQDRSTLEYGDSVSAQALVNLREFLQLSKERNVYVVGFITPFPESIHDQIMSVHDVHWSSERELTRDIAATFKDFDFNFLDTSDPRTEGIQETEFLDESHTTDKGSLRILIYMAQRDKTLQHYVSLSALQTLLKETPGPFIVKNIH